MVGWTSRPPEETVTWPKRPSWKCSVTDSSWGKVTDMPSYLSKAVGLAIGKVTSVGATVPVPHTTMLPGVTDIWVWSWNSDTLPCTVTTSPRSTEFSLLPLNTKIASDVAGSPSPTGSWR